MLNDCIRKITLDGDVSLWAGRHTPDQYLELSAPKAFAADNDGTLFVSNSKRVIYRILPGAVSTYAGGDHTHGDFTFGDIRGLSIDNSGVLYVIELGQIRRVMNGVHTRGVMNCANDPVDELLSLLCVSGSRDAR